MCNQLLCEKTHMCAFKRELWTPSACPILCTSFNSVPHRAHSRRTGASESINKSSSRLAPAAMGLSSQLVDGAPASGRLEFDLPWH